MDKMQLSNILSLEETLGQLKKLRDIDLRTATFLELSQLIREVKRHIAICSTLPVGRVICRTVSCNYLKNESCPYPTKVEQISFNPKPEYCGFNRASWEGTSVFYGSLSTDNLQGYETNSFEVLNDLQTSEKKIDRETFVIGKWIIKKELSLVHISGQLKHNTPDLDARADSFWNSIKHLPGEMLTLKAIDSFLCENFILKIPDNERWRYKLTAAYAQLVKEQGFQGLLYPSVKTDGAGYNVALFSDQLHNYIELERVALAYFYKRDGSIANEYVMEALPKAGRLEWKETYNHKLPPTMKKWYTGVSDDKSFDRFINYRDL